MEFEMDRFEQRMEFETELHKNEKHENQIEERILLLQAAVFQGRQCKKQRLSYTPTQITNFAGEVLTKADNASFYVEKRTLESEKSNASSHLVGKALGVETYPGEGKLLSEKHMFDCNICLKKAKDPVLTCCGHLFCWRCFYQLPYAYADARECPVCLGEVFETELIPIYGTGICNFKLKETDGSGSRIPPRPNTAESVRQKNKDASPVWNGW